MEQRQLKTDGNPRVIKQIGDMNSFSQFNVKNKKTRTTIVDMNGRYNFINPIVRHCFCSEITRVAAVIENTLFQKVLKNRHF